MLPLQRRAACSAPLTGRRHHCRGFSLNCSAFVALSASNDTTSSSTSICASQTPLKKQPNSNWLSVIACHSATGEVPVSSWGEGVNGARKQWTQTSLIEPIGARSHNRIRQWSMSECNWQVAQVCWCLCASRLAGRSSTVSGCTGALSQSSSCALAITAHSLTAHSHCTLLTRQCTLLYIIAFTFPLLFLFHLYVCLTQLFVSLRPSPKSASGRLALSLHSSYSSMFGAHRSSTALFCLLLT